MELITKEDKIKNAYNSWISQYPNDYNGIGEKLKTANTEQEIFEIIGNKSWTANHCYECKTDNNETVMLGEEPDYDSNTFYICKECLLKAINLLK